MAFTPVTYMEGESYLSPAAIVMIFEIEKDGLTGIWRSGLGIIVVWLLLSIGGLAGNWYLKRRSKAVSETHSEPVEVDLKEPE